MAIRLLRGQGLDRVQMSGFAADAVKGAGWFVRQYNLTAIHQRAGNGHPLLLPARQLGWGVEQFIA